LCKQTLQQFSVEVINNNNNDNVYGAVIVAESYCESSPSSYDEYVINRKMLTVQIPKGGSSVTLHWQRRLYDTRGNAHPNARYRHNFQKLCLDMQHHCSTVDVADWRQLLTHIAGRESKALCSTVMRIADKDRREHLEVGSKCSALSL